MALPVFRAASAKAAGTGAVTPALPTGVQANDIVILCATTIAGGTMSITTNGSISSWTAVTGSPIDVASGEKLWVWWGRYSSGSTGPTVTPGSDHACAGTVAYSGCVLNGSPIGVSAASTEATSDTSFSFATGLTTGENDCMCICVASQGNDSNTATYGNMTNASLSNLANRQDFCTNSGGGGGYSLQEGGKATAGTMGTFASTLSAASQKAYIAFSLRPDVSQTVNAGVGAGSAAGFAPSINTPVTVNAGVGAATLAGLAPQVPMQINVGVGAAALVGFAPSVTTTLPGTNVFPGVGAATLAGQVPQIPMQINVNVAAATLAGQAPTVQTPVTVNTGVGSASVQGQAPVIETPVTVNAGVSSAALAGLAPSFQTPVNVNTDTAAASVQGLAPSVSLPVSAIPGAADAQVTGQAPTVDILAVVSAQTAQADLVGQAPVIDIPAVVIAGAGLASLQAFAPDIITSTGIYPDLGQAVLQGLAPAVETPVSVVTGEGDLVLAGQAPSVSVPNILQIGAGALTLNGFAPEVLTSAGVEVEAKTGEAALTSYAPRIRTRRFYDWRKDFNVRRMTTKRRTDDLL